jgi:uncharacterized protein YdbL (DUF1318 family)
MRKIIFTLLMLFSISAFAISLTDARSSGMVAENDKGYIEAIVNTSEVQDLVSEVNTKRYAEYQRIASDTGTSLAEVEKLSAQKIIGSLPVGNLIKINGQVIKK